MPNILLAIESPDIGRIEFYPANALAATEAPDTAEFYFGGTLAAVEAPDQASISINATSGNIRVNAFESSDEGAIDILQGVVVRLSGKEAPDTASISVNSPIVVGISATEARDRGSINVLTGIIGNLGAVEAPDRASISFLGDSLITLAGVEAVDSAAVFISQAPVTWVRKAVVMHLFNHAVSEYVNYNFNSLMHFGGVFLGTNENGLYVLGGDDDLGEQIQAQIGTGLYDFGEDFSKRPKEAWLVYRSDGQMGLETYQNESTTPYQGVFGKIAAGIAECRAKLGKGLKGRFFRFVIKNIEGSSFDLESFRVMVDRLRQKTR